MVLPAIGFWSMLTRESPSKSNPVPGPWSAQQAAQGLVRKVRMDNGVAWCVLVTPLSKLEITTDDWSEDF